MTQAPDLPLWAAILTAFFLLAGSLITAIGSFGLVRLKNFYERVHAPTLGTTLGAGGVLIASMICFSVLKGRPVVHEVLIALFLTITTPVTLMLLGRAALYRDRTEQQPDIPRDFD
ncbi:cation:proton antiporter [Sandaracinobacter neustonicus]|uniref:Cation:proton antiporter n=1 Tax=Sandaracinobacter neustonicus TaxID=1715348 RepID=A0A501XV11_9SPHN|nr:monovalent cation/H(+) antiporter subunit G [Sandaracinobacter neustonicus]TPE63944.1 cation:proton antiporter [Sandaracinobacter neustonicus]